MQSNTTAFLLTKIKDEKDFISTFCFHFNTNRQTLQCSLLTKVLVFFPHSGSAVIITPKYSQLINTFAAAVTGIFFTNQY